MRSLFDRVVALAVLVVTSPLLLPAALAIKFSSRGPILFRARRAGLGGVPFTMYKLRTMHVGGASRGRITATNDPRVFPVGSLLRRVKLDEIPQFWNVVIGDMQLVGPRPEDVEIVNDHYDDIMWMTLDVPPGITSPGSLHYFEEESDLPSDPSEAEAMYLERLLPMKIAADLVYVRNPSFRYELQIILRTALGIIGADCLFSSTHDSEREEAAQILASWRAE